MTVAQKNLQRHYDVFKDEEQLIPFFKALAAYIHFANNTVPFSHIYKSQIAEYEEGNKKVQTLEEDTIREMIKVRDALEAIIKKRKIDMTRFPRLATRQFNAETDLFQEFESYLLGHSGNGFRSDSLQNYLFDLAANLLNLGCEKDLKKYLVSKETYTAYYVHVNGPKAWAVNGNVTGNFIFSPTWAARHKYVAQFELERELKPWGSFAGLMLFLSAYEAVVQSIATEVLLKNDGTEHNYLRTRDRVSIASTARDLKILLEETSHSFGYRFVNDARLSMPKLNDRMKSLKRHAKSVHAHLITNPGIELASEEANQSVNLLRFDENACRLYVKNKDFRIRRVSNQYDLLRVLFAIPTEVGKEWFFDEIAEKVDGVRSRERLKKYYNAAYQIVLKLGSKGVPDFFITTTESVQINRTYLS